MLGMWTSNLQMPKKKNYRPRPSGTAELKKDVKEKTGHCEDSTGETNAERKAQVRRAESGARTAGRCRDSSAGASSPGSEGTSTSAPSGDSDAEGGSSASSSSGSCTSSSCPLGQTRTPALPGSAAPAPQGAQRRSQRRRRKRSGIAPPTWD